MRIPVDQHQLQAQHDNVTTPALTARTSRSQANSAASSSLDSFISEPSSSLTMTPDLSQSASQAAMSTNEHRRHSTRSVKRRKFDDELVESSLNKHDRPRTLSRSQSDASEALKVVQTSDVILGGSMPTVMMTRSTRSATAAASASAVISSTGPSNTQSVEKVSPKPSSEKRKSSNKSSSKSKIKKPKHAPPTLAASTKDLGRWKPEDDLLLIEAVQQTSDLKCVHLGVKFSCNFTLREIEERWYTLLYNEKISKLAMTAIQQLPTDKVAMIQAHVLFSKLEEELLSSITVGKQPTEEAFAELLSSNIHTFHNGRTAGSLHQHWLLMKQYHLLPDQSVQPLPKGDHVLNFSDAEDMIDDTALTDKPDEYVQRELMLNDRKQKREIRNLEQEIPKWQVLVESVTGVSPPDFDNQTLAVLRGRLVRYLMRSKEISLGRSARGNQVDVDLALEGPAWKISRRQGMIKLRNNGEFIITNEGKRPIFVDGKPILPSSRQKLVNNSVIEVSCLRFIFLVNQDLIKNIKTEGQKAST